MNKILFKFMSRNTQYFHDITGLKIGNVFSYTMRYVI